MAVARTFFGFFAFEIVEILSRIVQSLKITIGKPTGREGGDGPNLGGPKLPRPFVPGYRAMSQPI